MTGRLHAVHGQDGGGQSIPEQPDALGRGRALTGDELERGGHAHGTRDMLGAGTPVSLTRPPCCWARMWVPFLIQRAPVPFGPSALWAPRATRSARIRDIEGQPGRGLDGVHVEQDPASRLQDAGDVGHGLRAAHLVVGEHHGHQDGAVRDRALDVGGIDPPVAVDWQLDNLEPELLEVVPACARRRGAPPA